MAVPKDLEDIRNHLYCKAERLWWSSFWLALGTQVLTLLAVWINQTIFIGVVGVVALTAPVVLTWLREKAKGLELRADKCRRLILYADGLGRPIKKEDLSEVRAWGMGSTVEGASFIAPYYSSTKHVGPNRLADIAAESAFFTWQLSDKVLGILWGVFVLSGALALASLFASDIIAPLELKGITGTIRNLAKSAAIVIAFLISGDFLLLIKQYGDLSKAASEAFRRCGSLREEGSLEESRIMSAVEDYNIALVSSPPIPARMYSKYREELNRIYRDSHTAVRG